MPKFDKKIKSKNKEWTFDGDVHKYFDDHVKKSVPFYSEVHELISTFSDYFVSDNSIIYDIGCSTGILLESIYERQKNKKNITLIGLDISKEMIQHAKNRNKYQQINFFNKNIIDYKLKQSSMILSIYTIQFIRPKIRQDIINKFYESLDWGGALFFFEKVRGADARFQDMMTSAYNEFKIMQGFDANEIFDKSTSLKGILEPFSRAGNVGLLKRAGFKDIETIFRYNCFEGYLAVK